MSTNTENYLFVLSNEANQFTFVSTVTLWSCGSKFPRCKNMSGACLKPWFGPLGLGGQNSAMEIKIRTFGEHAILALSAVCCSQSSAIVLLARTPAPSRLETPEQSPTTAQAPSYQESPQPTPNSSSSPIQTWTPQTPLLSYLVRIRWDGWVTPAALPKMQSSVSLSLIMLIMSAGWGPSDLGWSDRAVNVLRCEPALANEALHWGSAWAPRRPFKHWWLCQYLAAINVSG